MVDFREKLRRGLAAHQNATQSKKEIQDVVDKLSDAVSEETSGLIGVKVRSYPAQTSLKARAIAEFAAGLGQVGVFEQWLVAYAKNNTRVPDQKLAQFQLSTAGYPCTVRFGGERLDAYDKEGLENSLGSLLENSETGNAIERLKQDLPSKQNPSPSQ